MSQTYYDGEPRNNALNSESGSTGEEAVHENATDRETTPRMFRVDCYTDPLCSWSWASLPHWRRLREVFSAQLEWSYHMGGMIPNWQEYADPLNDIDRPAQMAPQWYRVRDITGVEIDESIWTDDPPTTSYPACVAFTAARLQGTDCEEHYLYRLWKAVMTQKRNIARRETLEEIAAELAANSNCNSVNEREGQCKFDAGRFSKDLGSDNTIASFRHDLQEIQYRQISRFPTLQLSDRNGKRMMLIGYRPYDVLAEAVEKFAARTDTH